MLVCSPLHENTLRMCSGVVGPCHLLDCGMAELGDLLSKRGRLIEAYGFELARLGWCRAEELGECPVRSALISAHGSDPVECGAWQG